MARTYVIGQVVGSDGTVLNRIEWYGKKAESKPTDKIADGSFAIETDSGDVYAYSEADSDWIEFGGDS